MNSGKEKKKVRNVFIAILLMFMILASFSTVMYAASGNAKNDENGVFLDPFGLTIMSLGNGSNNGASHIPPIKITIRPKLRSHFRPPMN